MGATLNELYADASAIQPATPGSYGVRPPAYRLPDSTRISAVTLQVSDLARSRHFYEHVLGFQPIAITKHGVSLGAVGSDQPILELVERRRERPGAGRKKLGLYHVAILLPSRAELGRFLRHLDAAGERAGAGDHLVSEALYLQDPDDLGIEVYADRPQSGWRRRGRELVMATDAVDVRGLMKAAGEESWSGMPAGTTIGHVHLHVGELNAAANFYSSALGFDRMVWSYPGALFMAAGGYHHHLGTNVWAGPTATAALPDEPQLLEWTLDVPSAADVDAAAASLMASGFQVESESGQLRAVDPWGTPLRLRASVAP
jgi:catechol 2,3-dioxygenase